jgi:Arc/MetJ-type ribon-helix-helix transcriptional regulator
MGIIKVRLPQELQDTIDRQVAAGRVESADAYLVEAARRFAEDLEGEDEIVAEAEAGIADADAEAGRYVTIATPEDAEAFHERTMARLCGRLVADKD